MGSLIGFLSPDRRQLFGTTEQSSEGDQCLFAVGIESVPQSTVIDRKLYLCFRFHLREQSHLLYPVVSYSILSTIALSTQTLSYLKH
jgi:hypothetical protein